MKKFKTKSIFLIAVATLILAGCGKGEKTVKELSEKVSTQEEAAENTARLFTIPEGAENVAWSLITVKDNESPLIQAKFNLDGKEFTARTLYGASEDLNISGIKYKWSKTEDGMLGWHEGNMPAKFYSYVGDESVELCTCYDIEIGIAYSISTKADNLEGFDMQAVVDKMEPEEEMMLSSFVEQAAGKDTFESYDEVISYLKPGQGYAYIKLVGYDKEFLLVTESTYNSDVNTNASIEAEVFCDYNGKIGFGTLVYTNGTAYPLAYKDGILYECKPHEYATCFATPDGAIMMKDCITEDYGENSEMVYIGFVREENDFEKTFDFTGGEKEYNEYWENYRAAEPINFTVVE